MTYVTLSVRATDFRVPSWLASPRAAGEHEDTLVEARLASFMSANAATAAEVKDALRRSPRDRFVCVVGLRASVLPWK